MSEKVVAEKSIGAGNNDAQQGSEKISPRLFTRLAFLALVMLVAITVTGAFVRLTGSGLGCSNWPMCTETRFVPELGFHGFVEFGNRVFSAIVGFAVAGVALAVYWLRPRRRDFITLALCMMVGVIAQAVIGGITVRTGLMPQWVMLHFLVSMLLIWAALVLWDRSRQPNSRPHAIVHADYLWLARTIVVLTAIVLVIGTIVTGSGPNGGDVDSPRFGFALHDIAKLHGAVVWLLVGIAVVTYMQLRRAQASSTLVRRAAYLLVVLLLQGVIGYWQYMVNVPPALAIFHVVGATAVWIASLWLFLGMHERYGDIGLDVYEGDVNAC